MRRFCVAFLVLTSVLARAQTDWRRYRIFIDSETAARKLGDSALQIFDDFVRTPTTDVIVGPGELPKLAKLGLPYQFISNLPRADDWSGQVDTQADDYKTKYLRYDAIIAQYDAWTAQNPRYMTRFQIGSSIQGRPIYAYRIWQPYGLSLGEPPQDAIIVWGAIHAREWVSSSVPMYITEQLLNNIRFNLSYFVKLHKVAVYVVPVLNPDGYEYTWTNDRYWRKNRRNNGGGYYGVDLNRNFGKGWGGGGSSGNKDSDIYRGTAAFSEPETATIRDFGQQIDSSIGLIGEIDYHSYGQYILYPWGYTGSPTPRASEFSALSSSMRSSILNGGGVNYTTGQIYQTLYQASGVSVDWFYDAFNILAMTVELRDTGNYGFLLPESQILPTITENWLGFQTYLFGVM